MHPPFLVIFKTVLLCRQILVCTVAINLQSNQLAGVDVTEHDEIPRRIRYLHIEHAGLTVIGRDCNSNGRAGLEQAVRKNIGSPVLCF